MNRVLESALAISAGGILLTVTEMLLPRSKTRSAAKTAIGILFFELLLEQIIGIFR